METRYNINRTSNHCFIGSKLLSDLEAEWSFRVLFDTEWFRNTYLSLKMVFQKCLFQSPNNVNVGKTHIYLKYQPIFFFQLSISLHSGLFLPLHLAKESIKELEKRAKWFILKKEFSLSLPVKSQWISILYNSDWIKTWKWNIR